MFSQHLIQTTDMSIGSTLYVSHANTNHCPCKWVCGTSFILTGAALLIDSLFVLTGSAGALRELPRRHWSRKIFIRREKGMSSLWCLLTDNVSWIKSDQRSGIIFLPLSHNTAHSSAVLKYKLKRQESSKAFPYISVWFQTELRGPRLMYAHVSRHLCMFKEYMPHSSIFLCLDVLQECKANCF